MTMDHWFTRTKAAMTYAGNGALWLPGSTTWRHYMSDLRHPERAIAEARRRGWLAGSGIPQLTAYKEMPMKRLTLFLFITDSVDTVGSRSLTPKQAGFPASSAQIACR